MDEVGLRAQLIWATRGRNWGFQFLLAGGFADPLPEYERMFKGLEGKPRALRRLGGKVAVRFPDPDGRRDASGRKIPHEFVLADDLAQGISTPEAAVQRVWPLVAHAYASIWDSDEQPPPIDLPPGLADPTADTRSLES